MYLRSCLLCVCVVTRRAGIKPAGVTRFKHGTETTVMRPTAEKHSETQSLGTNYGVLNLFFIVFLVQKHVKVIFHTNLKKEKIYEVYYDVNITILIQYQVYFV